MGSGARRRSRGCADRLGARHVAAQHSAEIVWELRLDAIALCEWAEALELWGGERLCAYVCNLCGTGDEVGADLVVPNRLAHTVISHMHVAQFRINGVACRRIRALTISK